MIQLEPSKNKPSIKRQCALLNISRSSLYYRPKGESAENLELMRQIDELYTKYPFYGSRQMVVVQLKVWNFTDGLALSSQMGVNPHLAGCHLWFYHWFTKSMEKQND